MIETYSPLSSRVKTYQVVSDQAPEFAITENPLFENFLEQYYISQEYQGGVVDIGENIDKYIRVDNLTKDVISGVVATASSITTTDDTITVSGNTKGFPQKWGLLKIDNEIITYTDKTETSFTGCVRGFSGITTYHAINDPKNLTFTESIADSHSSGANIQNLSSLFLKEFYEKLKVQYTPGLEGVPLSPDLDVNNFIKEARSLYESKGTDESFKILFKALFGLEPKINDLEKYLIKPSYANYLRRESFAVQLISGDPIKLIGQTLYQDDVPNNTLVNAASGPISEVVQIRDDYYRLSVFIGYDDRDLIQGTFVVPGKTQVIGKVGLGATVLTVDSTIGFGQTGTIDVGLTTETSYQKLDYTEKTVNQFIGVTTTTKDILSATSIYTPTVVYGYEDNDTSKQVNMRITGVLREFDSLQDLYGLSETSRVAIKNLGRNISNPAVNSTWEQTFFNSWIYNTSARYLIEDLSGSTVTLTGDIDKSSLKVGDTVELLVRNTETVAAASLPVTYVNNTNNSISIGGTFSIIPGLSYDIRRIQEKATSTIVPIIGGQNQILSDVTNTYILDAKNTENNIKEGYVASNSIPSYPIISDKVHSVLTNPTVSGGAWQGYNTLTDKYTIISFPQDVPFRTGEEIAYVPGGNTVPIGNLDKNSYFVEVLSQKNKIKLYPSRSFIPSGISVEFSPPNVATGIHDFVRIEQARKSIFPGRTLKRFILKQFLDKGYQQQTTSERTLDGNTGMLINGVEITNYKSDKFIYYGPLQSLDIVNSGRDYDVLYPPQITIENSTGINTAYGRVSIAGTVTDVLIDPIDYEVKKIISVDIHGGNGLGAKAQAVTELAYRQFTFNAKSFYDGGNIDPLDGKGGRFIMDKPHYYNTGDRVLYSSNNNPVIGLHTAASAGIDTCLVEGQSYYVGVTSATIFKLYRTKSDAVAGVANTVGFGTTAADLNTGIHQFRDYYTKRRISRMTILEGGSGYTNRRLSVAPAGISTLRDFVEFENHGFSNGEVVHYGISTTGGSVVSGLSSTAQYQVLKLDEDRFRLCYSGIATTRTPNTANYLNKEYVRFANHGTGYQDFYYPPVTVDVNVITDADTPQTIEANPIVRGQVVDTILYDKGRDYGSNIINFEKAPSVDINVGNFGQIGLTIVNGRIIDAFVQARGQDYDGPPDLTVTGVGTATGAKLRAVMNAREISSVRVLAQGAGYASTTTSVTVKAPGDSATFSTKVRRLVANKYKTTGTLNGDYLAPVEDGLAIESVAYGATVRNAFSDDGSGHSPIIGWAYDGNPIYGPYGFTDIDDIQSSATRMTTSYKLDSNRVYNRPSISDYEAGFFIEDYYYNTEGSLDEHNGRFAKTPEFPEGAYVYHASVDNILNPEFPYYIGDTYRGTPLRVNTVSGEKIKQQAFDFENSQLVRNTLPYKMFGDGVAYDFVYQPYKQIPNVATPYKIDIGSIDNIRISSPGTGYTIGAKIDFTNEDTGGSGALAYVDTLTGKEVTKIQTTFLNYTGTTFEWRNDRVIAHIAPSHDLNSKDFIQVAGLSTSVNKLTASHKIASVNYSTTLLEDGFVGLVTDIRVQYIPPTVSVGSTVGFSSYTPSLVGIGTTVGIGTETASILNIYRDDSTLRVRRSLGVTTSGIIGLGISYYADQIEIPLITDKFTSKPNIKYYFDATEAVGVGTTPGLSVTNSYQYLGVTTDRSLLVQTIYWPNHGLKTNDEIKFYFPPGTSKTIGCATTDFNYAGTFNLADGQSLYVTPKTNDTIGIKTTKSSKDLWFVNTGTTEYDYLFEKQEINQVTGSVQKITSTIQTESEHELSDTDKIDLIVKPGLATGIGSTTYTKIQLINNYIISNPFNIDQTGINTTSNRITANSHGLITGDRILYYGSNLPDGVTEREYYVIRIDDNTLSLANTLKEALGTPNVVNITSQGGSGQTINPINPQLRPYSNSDLVFDLSDSTLQGYDLKFYYDATFFNEFVGSGTSLGFEVVGVSTLATVGIGSTIPLATNEYHPTLTLKHSDTIPPVLFYNLFGPSGIVTTDSTVVNGTEIKYVDSSYTGSYDITSIGSTEFSINLRFKPESLQYNASDVDVLEYTTKSASATGGISTIRIANRGLNYSRLPGISSIAGSGINATLIPESSSINKLAEMTVPDDVYGYPSDNTLKPDAFIPRVVEIDSFATIDEVRVTYGGKFYINAPALALYDKGTGTIVDTGLITCELSDSAVTSATVSVPPIGLSNNDYGVSPIRNSNGISIVSAEAQLGILTCKITTPVLGYTNEPIAIGDSCLVEGISYDAGSGTGYNSGDYKFAPFIVTDYNDATNPRQVTFDLNGISTNPGTGATVSFGFGQITQSEYLARFEVVKGTSKFIPNEPFKRNQNALADIQLDFIDENAAKIIVSGAEPLEVNDILIGKLSGSLCRVIGITEFDGSFNIASSVKTLVGWRDNIGIINDTNQVLPDNDYYQNMSYAIESKKTYEELVTYVNDIVHPSGMKNFANTEIIAEGVPGDTNKPAEDAGGLVLDFIGDPIRVDSIYPFDLGRDFLAQGNISKFIELRTTRLSDFILNRTNRVLNIDDISPQFVSNESNDLSDYRVVAQYPAGRYFQRWFTQTVHHAEDPKKNQYQLNEFVSVTIDGDTYLLQKQEMKNFDQVGLGTGYIVFDTDYDPASSKTYLIARPNEPFDTNYEIKTWQQNFADSVGVGTSAFSHIRLDGGLTQVAAASTLGISTTTNVVGLSTLSTQAAIIHFIVIDNPGGGAAKQVDYFEYAVMHNGVDTYLTELTAFNSKQNLSGLSGPDFIGTFSSKIEGGLLKLDFENGSTNTVNVKYKTIAIDPSTVGPTTNYRFKIPFTPDGTERSGRIEASSQSKSGITTIAGISSITDLSVKSTVHVSYGATQSLHQIYLLTDPYNQQNFITETPLAAIGSTTGVGTFGSTYRPDGHINLEFHPSVAGVVSVTAYNEVMYLQLDNNGTIDGIGELNYGQSYESVAQNVYLGINNRDIKSFDLKYQGYPIYAQECNISDPNILDYSLGQFNQKHFFSTYEQLTYKPDSNLVGVGGSALVYQTGAGTTGYLPDTVYAIKDNNQQYRIALTENDAKIGAGVTFLENTGTGNQHRFSMRKRDSKSMISISGLVQKPISYTAINYTLDVPVAGFVTAFVLSGISSIRSGDLLKIEDEYSIVRTVGFGTTTLGPTVGIGTWTLVEIERGAIGTAATAHAAGETARLFRGSFQILDSKVHFTQAPLGGDTGIINPNNLPFARATFGGRTFLRQDYAKNQIFDDMSERFNGLETTYPLTTIGSAVTGIGSTGGNGVLFINNIFQAPYSENNTKANFKIEEAAGISSVVFTGISSFGYDTPIIDTGDINENQLPRGGIIVSVASTPGRGYAPFIGANVKPLFDSNGTLTSIVGVPTVGSAVAVSTAFYNNESGIMEVSTVAPHNLKIEDPVYLNGLQMECIGYKHIYRSSVTNALVLGGNYTHKHVGVTTDALFTGGDYPHKFVSALTNGVNVQSGAESGNQKTPNNATYNAGTGVLTLEFASNHGMSTNDTITLDAGAVTLTCERDNYQTPHSYPRSSDPISGVTTAITKTSNTAFTLNVGISTRVVHAPTNLAYDALKGEMKVAVSTAGFTTASSHSITTCAYDPTLGQIDFTITGHGFQNGEYIQIPENALIFTCAKDSHGTQHTYPRNSVGDKDRIANRWLAIDQVGINTFRVNVGKANDATAGVHTYVGANSPLRKAVTVIGIQTNSFSMSCERDNYSSIHTYPRAGYSHKFVNAAAGAVTPNVGTALTPTDASYNETTGDLTLTFPSHALVAGTNTVQITQDSLVFTCDLDGHNSQHSYPRTTDPFYGTNIAIASTTATTATMFVGKSGTGDPVNNRQIGIASIGVGQLYFHVGVSTISYVSLSDAAYNALTGDLTLSIGSTGVAKVLAQKGKIGIATGAITFSCDQDGYATNHAYPRVTDPYHNKIVAFGKTTSDTITVNVGKSGLGYGSTIGITSFVYDHVSGIATIIADANHNFTDPNLIGITTGALTFTCSQDEYATDHTYPRASDPVNDKFLEIRNVTNNTFDVFVGITSNVGWTPTNAVYDPVAGIMTMTIPNHNIMAGTTIKLKGNSLDFKCAMDGNSQTKSYPRLTDPYYNEAISVASTTATGIAITVGTSPTVNYSVTTATYTPATGFLDLNIGQHGLAEQTAIKLATGSLIFRCATDSYISSHAYPRNTIDTQTVNGAVYDANAGIMTVTVVPGGRLIHDGDYIRFDNDSISFKCDMDGGTSTKTYPRSSDPVSGKWLPITGIGTTSFTVEVGKSPIAPYSISSAVYDPTAGIVTATIGDHGLMTGQSIQISPESMSFRCGLDTYQSLHKYPRSSDPGFTTAVSIASTSANSISFQVLASQPSTNISTHHYVPHEGLTAESGTQYDGTVGIMTVTSTNHGLSNGDYVMFDTGAVSFTCAMDDYSTPHAYPRETDPYSGKWIKVSNVTTNTFRVNSMQSGLTGQSDHIFLSGVTGAIKRSQVHGGGAYGHTFQAAGVGSMDQKRDRAYDQPIDIVSVGATTRTITDGVYDGVAGIMTVTVAGHGFMNGDRVKFDDNSISFRCYRDWYRIAHSYPRPSDPISGKWVSIASTTVNTFAVDVGKSGPSQQFDHRFDSAVTDGLKKQTGYITLQVGIATDTSEHRYDIGAGHEATNAVVSGGNYAHTFQSATTGAVQYGGDYSHQFVSAASSALYIDSWSGAALTPTNAVYNPSTGIIQFTANNHGLVKPENFKLAGIGVTCTYGSKTYPSGVQGYYYTVRSVGTTTSFTTFVGVSTLTHPYTGGGIVRVGLTTNIYPDYDQQLDVVGIISAKTFTVNAGPSTIPHSYHAGGTAAPYYELSFGSGYTTDLQTITEAICVVDSTKSGAGATVTATVGAGGTLIYSIDHAGSGYIATNTYISAPWPSGSNLAVTGSYREGLGNTTTTGVGCSVTVDIIGLSTNFVGYSTGSEFQLNEVYIWKMTKFGYGFKRGDKINLVGLSTDPTAGDLFIPFEIEVINVFSDDVAAWQFGNIDYIDNIKTFQDGARKRFPLYYQNQLVSFEIDNNDSDSREIDLGPVLMIFVNGVLQEPYKHYEFTGGTSVSFETAPTTEDDVFIFFYRGTVGADSSFFDVNEIIKEGDSLELFKSAEIEKNTVPKITDNFDQNEPRIVSRIATASVVETPFYQGGGVSNDNYKPIRWNKQKADKVFGGAIVSKARDSSEAQIYPTANVIAGFAATDTTLYVDHTENFRDLDGQLTDDFGLYVYGVGVGTTAQAGVNWEVWNDIDPLVTDVKGYTGLITGITTSVGIGTDLGIVFQLDTNNLVNSNNASFVTGFATGYPFKVYGTGISPAAGVITSTDTHDSDVIGISTFEVDNIYYAHALSWDGSARTGVITCNIHSGTDVSGLVGVGSTLHPAARFTWGRFSSAIRDVSYPIALTVKGLDYNPDLDNFPIAQRRNIGLRNTGAFNKTL